MKNKIIKTVSFILANTILLIILSIVYGDMNKAASMVNLDNVNFYIIIIGLILFICGILIEYDRVFQAIRRGFNINKVYFLLAIIMLIISCLPIGSVIRINFKIGEMLNYIVIRDLFSIWSGILISRSLVIKTLPVNN